MLLRRFSKLFKEQDWRAIFLELGVVVIGVFLGLQVENGNRARIERQAAVVYRGRLIEEIRRNEHNLVARQQYYFQVREYGQAALDSLQSPDVELDASFVVNAYMASQRWLLEVDRGVYDEILSTGVVNSVLSAESRTRLSNYYVVFAGILTTITDDISYRKLVRTYVPIEMQRSIEAACGDMVSMNQEGAVSISLREFAPDWDDAATEAALESLLSAPDLARSLNFRLSDVETKLTVLQRNIDRSRLLAEYFDRLGASRSP